MQFISLSLAVLNSLVITSETKQFRSHARGKNWQLYEPWNPSSNSNGPNSANTDGPSVRYVAWKEKSKYEHPKAPISVEEALPTYCQQIPDILNIKVGNENNYIYEHLTLYKSIKKGGDQHYMRASPMSCLEDFRQHKLLKNGKKRGFICKAKHMGIVMCDNDEKAWKVVQNITMPCSLDVGQKLSKAMGYD